MKSLQYYWYQSNIFLWLLLPISWLYCLLVFIRRKLYKLNIKKSYDCKVPVIIIGNIVAGGSGKTPLLISLCEFLKDKGFSPGVVSRGYGGSVVGAKQIQQDDSAAMVGDEPLMIYQRTKVPVVVGTDRVSATELLLMNNNCDVILSDDGLQHYRMRRDFEVAVVDSSRMYGNGFCLPAGPLRERLSRLNEVDMIVYNDDKGIKSDDCSYKLVITTLRHLGDGSTRLLASFTGKELHAVAGIGNPSRFFSQLEKSGISIIKHAFSDHYVYQQNDFSGWEEECILMTEKDAVKCQHLALKNVWVVSVNAIFSTSLELSLSDKLLPLLKK